MKATLDAVRGAFPGRRVLVAFQPHRYTRTRDCFEDFVKVLSSVEALVLADVYPAGEKPIVGADGRSLARAIRIVGQTELVFVDTPAEMDDAIMKLARDGDVVVTMGQAASAVYRVVCKLVPVYRNNEDTIKCKKRKRKLSLKFR